MKDKLFKPSDYSKKNTLLNETKFNEMYQNSIDDPISFWKEEGKTIDWIKPYTNIKDVSFSLDDLHIKWYQDGTLNASYNCLDRHLDERGDQIAIIWEGDNPNESKKFHTDNFI